MKTVIKASAGTGKTYRLSLEYIYYLLKGIDFNSILVMTFTKKATFEIKERIFEFMNQIVTETKEYEILKSNIEANFGYKFKKEDKEKLSNIYREMLINKDNIRIHTIDGFIASIFNLCIAEPILSIYEYDLLESDSEEEKILYEELVLNLIKNPKFKYKFKSIETEKIKKEIGKMLQNKSAILQSTIEENKIKEDEIIRDIKYLFLDKYINVYNYKLTAEAERFVELLEKTEDFDDIVKGLDKVFPKSKKINGIFKNKKEREQILGNKDFFNDLLNLFYKIFEYKKIKASNEIIENGPILFKEEFKLKKRKKVLDFNDITYYTLKHIYDKELKLIENETITESFEELMGGKFEVIMIDEFQDTSIDQFKLLKLLINKAKYVTCVGDEKQSIYEWRGGYKKLFEELELSLGEDTVVKNLGTCFRSEEKIIEFVNEKFNNIPNYNYIDVISVKKERNKGFVDVKQLTKSSVYSDIVNDIKENGDYANSAVLLRNNTDLEKISNLLENEKIPYSLSSRSNFLLLPVINSVHKLVEYLVTKNEVNKYEFLRSQVFSYTLEDIQKIINKEIDTPSILEEFVENYNKVNSINSGVYDFRNEYLKYFGYGSKKPTKVDIVNLNEYFTIMKGFENLKDFYDYLKNNKSSQKPVIEDNSVKLMTIHASKGLEFKNVYTLNDFDVNSKEDSLKKYVKYDKKYNIEEFYFVEYKYIYTMYKILEDCSDSLVKQELLEYLNEIGIEKIRDSIEKSISDAHNNLNYVAYTRARENLFIYYIKDQFLLSGNKTYGSLELGEVKEYEYEEKDYTKYSKYFKPTQYLKQLNTRFTKDRVIKQKEGSAIHYFFEVYDLDVDIAKDTVKKKYGNLLSENSFSRVMETIDKNLENYNYLYKNSFERYSEFKIYDKLDNDKMYIIDLLLIDRENKKAYIYDFKTGENVLENIKYKEQINKYKNILSEYLEDYEIQTEILALYH